MSKRHLSNQRGMLPIFEIILVVAALAAVGAAVYFGVQANNSKKAAASPSASAGASAGVSSSSTPTTDQYAGWKTYTSTYEKASFHYPSDWKQTAGFASSSPAADSVTMVSSDGSVKVAWVTGISGLGGACDSNISVEAGGCAQVYVVSKTAVPNAAGLYVVEGIITRDNAKFEPWVVVQGQASGSLISDIRTMGYDAFVSRNSEGALAFSTNSTYPFNAGGTDYSSKAEAATWFNKAAVQQARLIMLSFTY